MFKRKIIAFISMIMLASSVNAEDIRQDDTGWFAGGLFGYTDTKTKTNLVFSQNERASFYGPYGGINFTDWFGLEGKIILTGDVANDRENLISAEYFGILFTPKFSYRFNRASSVYAKAGVGFLDYKEEYDGNIFTTNRLSEESWDGSVVTVGVGVQFDIIKGLKMRVNYERLTGRLRSERVLFSRLPDVEVELNQLSFGMHYQF